MIQERHRVNGVFCEFLAAAYFTRNGYVVSWPTDSSIEYDFIIDNLETTPLRVQVKKIFYDNSKQRYISGLALTHIQCDGKTISKKYGLDSFDICAFVCAELNAIYVVPIEYVAGRRSITFYPEGRNPDYRCPFDYEQFKEVLINLYD